MTTADTRRTTRTSDLKAQPALVTLDDAAAELNLSVATLRWWVAQNGPKHGAKFVTVKVGRRRLVRRADLDAFIAALPT